MTRHSIKRILITLGVTAGIIATTASHASAGLIANHTESTLR
jgi:thiamine phosphate synthase YjbQ (UPF0047 family)